MRQASRVMILRLKRSGISLRKIGMKSPRPVFTASRQLPPINRELLRNMPGIDHNYIIIILVNSIHIDHNYIGKFDLGENREADRYFHQRLYRIHIMHFL